MLCSSTTNDVLLCTETRASDVVRPNDMPPREETAGTSASEDEASQRFQRLAPSDELLSVRGSLMSTASFADVRCEHKSLRRTQTGSTSSGSIESPSAETRKRSRFEEKLRVIAHYIKTMSIRPHRHVENSNSHKHVAANGAPVKRKSQVNLSRYSQPTSAPDVLDIHKRDITAVGTTISQSTTSLSWDEICAGAVFIDENEVMPPSPHSRKRGRRSTELFEESELQKLCAQCDVPARNINTVVEMIRCNFGTCNLDLTELHRLVKGNSVVLIGMLVFACIDCGGEYLDLHSLPVFLREIQSRYDERNPFHNGCHAADVLHSQFMMLWTTALGERIAVHNQIGVLFAAIMHDIEHIGLTNDFLLKTNHSIAVRYPTKAPMEELHMTVALSLLTDPKFNVLGKMTNEQHEQVVTIARETIRSTALCYQKKLLEDVAAVSAEEWETSSELGFSKQVVALRIAMHVSDISQTMKPYSIHSKWVQLLNEELFLQGDLDQRMQYGVCPESCFRDKWNHDAFLSSQVWFLQNMALPAAMAVNSIPWLNAPFLEDNLHANIAHWQAQLGTSRS